MLAKERALPHIRNVQTSSDAQPSSYKMGSGNFYWV